MPIVKSGRFGGNPEWIGLMNVTGRYQVGNPLLELIFFLGDKTNQCASGHSLKLTQLVVGWVIKRTESQCRVDIVFHLGETPLGDVEESNVVSKRLPSTSKGSVSRNRYGGTSHLLSQSEALGVWEVLSDLINQNR